MHSAARMSGSAILLGETSTTPNETASLTTSGRFIPAGVDSAASMIARVSGTPRIAEVASLGVSVALGLATAVHLSMVGAMGRELGAREATWVSILSTLTGLAIVVAVQVLRGRRVPLPHPLDRRSTVMIAVTAFVAVLLVSVREIPVYFALTGMNATVFLILTGILVPRLGVALFFAVVTFGTVGGALIVDDLGAFGAVPRDANLVRVIGVGLVGVGTAIVVRAK